MRFECQLLPPRTRRPYYLPLRRRNLCVGMPRGGSVRIPVHAILVMTDHYWSISSRRIAQADRRGCQSLEDNYHRLVVTF